MKQALLACLLAVHGMWAQQFSSPVRDVENPDRTVFEASCIINWTSNETGNKTCVAPVTASRWIMTSVSASCYGGSTALFGSSTVKASGGVDPNGHRLFLNLAAMTTPFGAAVESVVNLAGLRILVKPDAFGSYLMLSIAKGGNSPGSCSMIVQGYAAP